MATTEEKLSPLARILGEKGQATLAKLTSFMGSAAQEAEEKGVSAKEKKVTEKDEEEVAEATEGEQMDEEELAEMVEFVGAVVAEMVMPEFEKLQSQLAEMKTSSTKETSDSSAATVKLENTVKEQAATIKALETKLQKLNGDTPRHSLKAQRASQAEDTVVEEKDVEGVAPEMDSLTKMISTHILGG